MSQIVDVLFPMMNLSPFVNVCKVVALVVLLSVFFTLEGQAQEQDFQIWGDVSVKYKINKKLKLSSELGMRTRENSRLLKQNYMEIGGRYKIIKLISIGAKYRYTNYFLDSKTSVHRMNMDVYLQKKWGRTHWALRERFQHQWFVSDYKNKVNVQSLRSRIQLSYNIRKTKLEPYFAVEHYLGLNGSSLWLTQRLRWTLGLEFPLNKWSDIAAAYRIQREYYQANPLTSYVFLLSYKISLK
jgi:hypothetical protein